jgi:quercetin dioxygenase-like cupin family protein
MGKEENKNTGKLNPAEPYNLATLLDYLPGSIVSRTLVAGKAGTVTLFSFDAGQGLSEHSAPFDAMVQILDGETELIIGGKPMVAKAGDTVIMPADIPHAVRSERRSKILLTMIRG